MGKVIFGMRVSLDGFVADRNGDSSPLYPDLAEIRDNEVVKEEIERTGAVILGRRSYDMAEGDFTGYEFQVPIFVLTHSPPSEVAKGQNENLTITFVTDGVESAVEQANAAAGDRDVVVIGADTGRQLLTAGLADELRVGIVPILFGDGLRLFDHLDPTKIELERVRVVETPTDTTIDFRVTSR
jgi:dihydrofolate reductase